MRFALPRACVLALLLQAASTVSAVAAAPDITLSIVADQALTYLDQPERTGRTLMFDATRADGDWQRVWADAPSFNKGVHQGFVSSGELQGDKLTLTVSFNIGGDAWVKGGRWRGTFQLQKSDQNRWTGTYDALFRGKPVKGSVYAIEQPKPAATGIAPAAPDEHPRLMFRKADLPALREKAKTEFGQAALSKMNGIIGNALKYQLTGDKKLAQATIPEVEKLLADNGVGDKMVRGRILGWRFEQIALAYDTCYDVYPDDLKRRIEAHVAGYQGWRAFRSPSTFQKEISWSITGTYPWPIRYGPAMAAVSVWGMKGPEPAKPAARPFLHDEPIMAVAPAANFKPAEGVPVTPFTNGKTPRVWLVAGGFKTPEGVNHLSGFDAALTMAPTPGADFTFNNTTKKFERFDKMYGESIPITDALKREMNTTGVFYTVIDNDAPRHVLISRDTGGRLFLNGTEFRAGDVAKLDKGYYQIVHIAATGMQSQWGNDLTTPSLRVLTQDEANDIVATRKLDHAEALAEYEFDLAQWRKTGGMSLDSLKLVELSSQFMRNYIRNSIGDGGFKGASHISLEGPPKYAVAYRNTFGRPITAQADLSMYLARMMFTQSNSDKATLNQSFDGTQNFIASQYIEHPYDTGRHLYATLFPLTDTKLRPAVLWGWQKHVGIDTAADAIKVFEDKGRITPGYPVESHVAWAFVNYPLNETAKHPAEIMPKTMTAPTFGWLGFRNAFKDQNDFVLQVFANSREVGPGGTENAGAFRLMGLGQYWAVGGSERVFENVVQMPDVPTYEQGRGRITHTTAQPDGSGTVTIDLADAYLSAKTRGLYEQLNGVRLDASAVSLGIKATRSIAVDYSGKSGVPCLVVIADKISGDGAKVWAWPTQFTREARSAKAADPKVEGREYNSFSQDEMRKLWAKAPVPASKSAKKGEEAEPDDSIAFKDVLPVMKGNAFTITKGNATLQGTLVSPPRVKVEVKEREQFRMGAKHTMARSTSTGVSAESSDKDVTFICVVTVGPGEQPAVSGDANTITVGSQTIRFDGEKLIIGK